MRSIRDFRGIVQILGSFGYGSKAICFMAQDAKLWPATHEMKRCSPSPLTKEDQKIYLPLALDKGRGGRGVRVLHSACSSRQIKPNYIAPNWNLLNEKYRTVERT